MMRILHPTLGPQTRSSVLLGMCSHKIPPSGWNFPMMKMLLSAWNCQMMRTSLQEWRFRIQN
ncbi:hypothetical protein DXG01_010025, partial [Tephrocybe rancida]